MSEPLIEVGLVLGAEAVTVRLDGGFVDTTGAALAPGEHRVEATGDRVRHLVADEMTNERQWHSSLDHEVVCRQRDGEKFPAEINLSAISAGGRRLVAIGVRDISHR